MGESGLGILTSQSIYHECSYYVVMSCLNLATIFRSSLSCLFIGNYADLFLHPLLGQLISRLKLENVLIWSTLARLVSMPDVRIIYKHKKVIYIACALIIYFSRSFWLDYVMHSACTF